MATESPIEDSIVQDAAQMARPTKSNPDLSMSACLTILIPNFNRPLQLARLLQSVFFSIASAGAHDKVEVLVVDDFSQEDVITTITPYLKKDNFRFETQLVKCGNAELSFLSALALVHTEFVWLVGNDDELLGSSVGDVLRLVGLDISFILLNPIIVCSDPELGVTALSASSPAIYYDRCEDLFYDFGFVTSTTTFPCLIMRVKPVRDFHQKHMFTQYSNVYSHSFSIFCAFKGQTALFYSAPAVIFNLNKVDDEMEKLELQSEGKSQYFHQCLGLARLISAASDAANVPIRQIACAREDEFSKTSHNVVQTYLCFFLMHFFIEQMRSEQNSKDGSSRFMKLSNVEINEVRNIVDKVGYNRLALLFNRVVSVSKSKWRTDRMKSAFLKKAQRRLVMFAQAKRKDGAGADHREAEEKMSISGFQSTPLTGRAIRLPEA